MRRPITRRMAGIYTAAVSGTDARPIGAYERGAASVRPWDPRSAAVAERVIALIRSVRPDLHVEHIGSTAVPGLPGKGIVDLGTEAEPAEIPAITAAMSELGFGPQPGPDPWPPTRPMHVGSIVEDGTTYLVHFHVHPRGTGDLEKDLRFRDALRADRALRDEYADAKTQIVGAEGMSADRTRYQVEKGDWILGAFDRLGLPRPANMQFAHADGGGRATDEQAGGTR
jgi:dephospho-CoA kinase